MYAFEIYQQVLCSVCIGIHTMCICIHLPRWVYSVYFTLYSNWFWLDLMRFKGVKCVLVYG